MPSFPNRVSFKGRFGNFRSYVFRHLNFYRIHLIFLQEGKVEGGGAGIGGVDVAVNETPEVHTDGTLTFTPLIFSGIFYAANGEFHISYIDCLFNCVSAMTVCGLASVDLSSLTGFQQALLFIQMCLGSPVVISWMMVYIRRSFFARKFQRIAEAELARRAARQTHMPVNVKIEPWWKRAWKLLRLPWKTRLRSLSDVPVQEVGHRGRYQLRPDMIRRVEGAPKLVDPSGWISEGVSEQQGGNATTPDSSAKENGGESTSRVNTESTEVENKRERSGSPEQEPREPQPTETSPRSATSPMINSTPILRTQTMNRPQRGPQMARTQTVEFAATPQAIAPERRFNPIPQVPGEEEAAYGMPRGRRSMSRPTMSRPTMSRPSMSRPTMSRPTASRGRGASVPRSGTITTAASHPHPPRRTMHRGFGGFPMPHEILSRLFGRAFPQLERKLTRTITIPRTRTIASEHGTVAPGARAVPYISFEAVVGRNSVFQALTREQLEELGGVEYRALTALLWIVAGYHIGLQLLAFIVIAPYMSISQWRSDFVPPALHRAVPSTWFSAFQVVSSYTNTGMSLVDTSMVPFQRAYPMIVFMVVLILAGNTAFPILLRFEIWILSKLVPKHSRINETLHFLLDHPRRCFVYLFPSHQTWFLLTVLFALNFTDWFFFLVLDIGNPAMSSIPVGVRFIIGLLQATAVRAAGFGTVALSALAPAVKVLYVLMMYVSVYPIALSVRSTNVYEEKSLGVYTDDESEEEAFNPTGNRATVWGRYLAMHARKQLSFDMWWLGLALFLVCIIERDGLDDESNSSWFNIFNILFDLVSAYGTVGLSLGVPFANYSFSGALRPLSKLIVCAVMLRGRHRGLPVAIDRAVMLPYEFKEGLQDGRGMETDEFGDFIFSESSSSSDDGSEHSLDDLSTRSGRDSTTQVPPGVPARERSPTRGRATAPRMGIVHAETVRRMEEQTNEIVDQQLHKVHS